MGDRFFIFINSRLDPRDETLPHELYHVLFNRGHFPTLVVGQEFFSFNPNNPETVATAAGLVLPDVRLYRRIQNLHSPDPNNDPAQDNILNWFRRRRTTRVGVLFNLFPATAATGNNLVGDF